MVLDEMLVFLLIMPGANLVILPEPGFRDLNKRN